jgi:outer membrane protein assembly factor BamB
LWATPLSAPPAHLPAFDAARMFAILRDGTLVAVDHLAGKVIWTVTRSASVPPVATAGLVVGAHGPAVWALDAATGQEKWTRQLDDGPALPLSTAAGGILIGTAPGGLLMLAGTDGRIVWRVPLGATPTAVPVESGGLIVAGLADGRVLGLDALTGAVTWTRKTGGAVLSLTALPDRILAGSADNFFYSLSPRDGGVDWRWRTGGDVTGTAVADARRVYFLSLDNTLRALDRKHGDLKWQRPLTSRPVGGPQFVGEFIVLAQVAPELRCFTAGRGDPACVVSLPGRPLHRPFLATDQESGGMRLVFLSGGGQAVAVGPSPEPPLVPMTAIPGRVLAPEVLPVIR